MEVVADHARPLQRRAVGDLRPVLRRVEREEYCAVRALGHVARDSRARVGCPQCSLAVGHDVDGIEIARCTVGAAFRGV
jgi:hypothetical protein